MTMRPLRDEATSELERRAARALGSLESAPRPSPPPWTQVERALRRARWVRLVTAAVALGTASAAGWVALRQRPAPDAGQRLSLPPERSGETFTSAPGALSSSAARQLVDDARDGGGRPAAPSPRRDAPPLLPLAAMGPPPVVRSPSTATSEERATSPRKLDGGDSTSSASGSRPAVDRDSGSTLGEEARLLSAALAALRRDRLPEDALQRLAEYRQRFPEGVLRTEAMLAQAEAERARHQPAAALAVLASMRTEPGAPMALEVLVARGDLGLELGDWARAEAGFLEAQARGATGDLAERASFGRARCALALDRRDAGQLLRAYLEQWPEGHFVDEVRSLLESSP